MSLEVVGALCVAIALVGGGLQIGGVVNVPQLSRTRLIVLAVVGVVFIAVSITQEIVTAPNGSMVDRVRDNAQGRS